MRRRAASRRENTRSFHGVYIHAVFLAVSFGFYPERVCCRGWNKGKRNSDRGNIAKIDAGCAGSGWSQNVACSW